MSNYQNPFKEFRWVLNLARRRVFYL